jgi:hypothetical protein
VKEIIAKTKNFFMTLLNCSLMGFLFFSLAFPVQAVAQENIISSIGFSDCNITPQPSSSRGDAGGKSNEAAFSKCLQQILRFFFVLGIFFIAVRIAIEALLSMNPFINGAAVSNSIKLVQDVVIGLILIGIPGGILSVFNLSSTYFGDIVNLGSIVGTNTNQTNNNQNNQGNNGNNNGNPTGADNTPITLTDSSGNGVNIQTPEDLASAVQRAATDESLRIGLNESLLNALSTNPTNPTQARKISGLLSNKIDSAILNNSGLDFSRQNSGRNSTVTWTPFGQSYNITSSGNNGTLRFSPQECVTSGTRKTPLCPSFNARLEGSGCSSSRYSTAGSYSVAGNVSAGSGCNIRIISNVA